jgi:hypothetical protein
MSYEIRKMIDMVRNYRNVITESDETNLKLSDLLIKPEELNSIFDICRNEIYLSNNDIEITQFYSRIYMDCLLQYNDLTFGNVNIISELKDTLTYSGNKKQVLSNFKRITHPTHNLPATLLKMLTDYKKIQFINEKYQKYSVFDILSKFVISMFTNNQPYSETFRKQLVKSYIKVVD